MLVLHPLSSTPLLSTIPLKTITFGDQDEVRHRNMVACAAVVSASLPFLILAEPYVSQSVAKSSRYPPFLMKMIRVAFPIPTSIIFIHQFPPPFF